MSKTRARFRTQGTPEKVGIWLYVLVGVVILMFTVLPALGPWWWPVIEDSHETAPGRVLETRIAIMGTEETYSGSRILYRIEAHVRYDRHGQVQDRWMGASEVSSNRDILNLRLVKHPSSCEVYWAPGHPENPQCFLK